VHEYSVAASLHELAEERARRHGASRVVRLEVSVGELSGVEVPLLETAWSLVRERSLCDGAALVVRAVPARWECPRCGERIAAGLALRCEPCRAPAQLARGGELVLERIEMEVA
jgi:hydrogenase nickel incorporation protein HypA/HybF